MTIADTDTERKTEADAPVPEHVEIPNDDTIVVGGDDTAEGVEAQSPRAEDVDQPEEPQSMLEAVQKELEGETSDPVSENVPEEGEAKAEAPEGTETETESEKAEDFEYLKADVTDDELKNYSKKANLRIRQLVDERNTAKQSAEQVAPIIEFLDKNDIAHGDLDIILDLSAKLRHGDFAGFLNGVSPYIDMAQQYTGQKLPPDLHQQVQEGLVAPKTAQELAHRRIADQMHQQEVKTRDARDQHRNAREQASTIQRAVTNWEQQKQQQDPDYGLKADMIRRTAQALMQENGVATSVEQALGYADKAYSEVNDQIAKVRPQRPATAARPSGSVTKGGTAPRAEPSSMLEAAMQGLETHRKGS